MRKLCFGGSFNPIHHGHLICARYVAEHAGFDRIILIPSGQPPHKTELTSMAAASHRLAMCQAAIADDSLFEVDQIEINRPGASYTVDTARQLRSLGWSEIVWLIGADTVPFLPTWHQSAALMAEVKFIAMTRPGSNLDSQASFQTVAAPLIDISSSDIRRRLAAGQSIDYLTPPAVIEYIRKHDLYGPGK
jgi:nicotinate-nucleotide adenylyltransferase